MATYKIGGFDRLNNNGRIYPKGCLDKIKLSPTMEAFLGTDEPLFCSIPIPIARESRGHPKPPNPLLTKKEIEAPPLTVPTWTFRDV